MKPNPKLRTDPGPRFRDLAPRQGLARRAGTAFGIAAVAFFLSGQGAQANSQIPVAPEMIDAPAVNPNPVPTSAQAPKPAQAPDVAGIQIVAEPPASTVAPSVVTPALVVTAPAQVLASVQEQAEDVAFTGTESNRYVTVGVALTVLGGMLIAVTRRRRRA